MRRIYPDERCCMGCGLCRLGCRFGSVDPQEILKRYRTQSSREPRIRLDRNEKDRRHPLVFAIQCRQCLDAWCIEACLTGAIHRDEKTGVVIIDRDKCIGCWTCVIACPYACIFPEVEGDQRKAAKCEMCLDEDVPPCVLACPNNALVLDDAQVAVSGTSMGELLA